MTNSIKKFTLLLAMTALLASCSGPTLSTKHESTDSTTSDSNETSSNSSETSNSVSTSSISQPVSSVNHNPNDCTNHQLNETVIQEATLLEKGIKNYKCSNCGADFNDSYYKMDEFVFDDMTYMDDGQEHQILIEGVLPYGVTVKYENNTLKGIGSKEATAKFFDENNHQILEKKAKLNIVENIGLPIIRVVTADGEDPDWRSHDGERVYKSMNASVDNCADEYKKSDIPGEIKVRGNSTNQEQVAKRAFRLKFSGKTNLLGLNDGIKEKSWVLLADFFDQSKFRNATAFEMGNSLFNYSGFYSSDYKHVTLYMNGENRGVYLLAEQQQAKKNRIPVNEPDEGIETTKVGYLLEIDGLVTQQGKIDKTTGLGVLEGDPCFATNSAGSVNGVNISSKGMVIKTDTWNDEQRQFIRKYMNSCIKAFASTCNGTLTRVNENGETEASTYSTAYETLNSFIDLDSFFRMYLLQEFLKDYDVGWGSFYMYIDFSGNSTVKKLTMSAPWDFDLGVGNKQSGGWGGWGGGWGGQQQSSSDSDIPTSGISSTGDKFLSSSEYTNGMTTFNPWLYLLSQTDFFQNMFKKYYSIFDNSGIFARMINNIEYERVAFLDAFNDNHTRYGKGASGATLMQTRQYNTFGDAADYLVKWLKERKASLDTTWGK